MTRERAREILERFAQSWINEFAPTRLEAEYRQQLADALAVFDRMIDPAPEQGETKQENL